MQNFLFIFVLAFFTVFPALAQNATVPETESQIKLSFAPLVKKVAPAVVNIYTTRMVATGFRHPFANDPFFGQFFQDDFFGGQMRGHIEGALGSGVILQEDGLVVTNAHVISGADSIVIGLADGREFEADIAVSDEASDLALLRIREKGLKLPYVTLKPSESLEVGDLVLAIGNPFGVGQTVTSGIVSAQGRSSLNVNDFNFFIQTDAAINPGNSGGPLVDMTGHVVGINTVIYSRSGGSMGVGFAIPSEMVAAVIAAEGAHSIQGSRIVRPWLGVDVENVTPDIAQSLGLKNIGGVLISGLHSVSPLQKAGLKVGDVVLGLNGKALRDAAELKFRMATVPIGQEAKITVLRGEESFDVNVSAIAPPDEPPREEMTLEGEHLLNGATLSHLNPAVAIELGLPEEQEGVVVLNVAERSTASRVVLPGDILHEVNGVAVQKPQDVERALSANTQQRGLSLTLERRGRTSKIYIR